MASRKKIIRQNDVVEGVLTNRRANNSKKKSPPSFVELNGLSQSAKDRLMNNRTVKPPKNLNLIEGDPVDTMEREKKSRQSKTFPNEHLLSSKIKEVNGMDYSNHFIEQYYRQYNSNSASPEISEDSANSSFATNDSMRSNFQEEEICTSNVSGSTGVGYSKFENNLPAHCSDANYQEDNFQIDNIIRNSRYSKNAAIIGLIKQNMISLGDLELDIRNPKSLYPVEEFEHLDYSVNGKNAPVIDDNGTPEGIDDNSKTKFDSKPDKISNYPHLVPHPEDPDFFTHPLQAYGRVDDRDIDFRLPRLGQNTTITPRQYFIAEGLKADKFTFQRNTKNIPSKPKNNVHLPKIQSVARSSYNDKCSNAAESNNSYNRLINDENDRFRLNHDDFPTLKR